MTPCRSTPACAAAVLAALSAAALILPGQALAANPLNPVVTITGGPSGSTTDRTPTFTFTSQDTNVFQCRIDGGAYSPCSSPFTSAQLGFANHAFQVRGIGLGLFVGSPATRQFTVVDNSSPPPDNSDTTPPNTTITAGPADKSRVTSSTVTFEFASNEAGSTFECQVDSINGNYSACPTPFVQSNLNEGSHTLLVRAVDPAGNKDQTPEYRSYLVDAVEDPPTCLGVPVTIMGTDQGEEIVGTDGPDSIYALAGDDRIDGGLGADRICAAEGNDDVTGGGGADFVALGPGNDRVNGGLSGDDLGGGPGADRVVGGPGADNLGGSSGGDTLSGEGGNDKVNGGAGQDRCDGGSGKDRDKQCERTIGVP